MFLFSLFFFSPRRNLRIAVEIVKGAACFSLASFRSGGCFKRQAGQLIESEKVATLDTDGDHAG